MKNKEIIEKVWELFGKSKVPQTRSGVNVFLEKALTLKETEILKILENYPFPQVNITKTAHQVREELKQKITGK